jgi:hypothetical protein
MRILRLSHMHSAVTPAQLLFARRYPKTRSIAGGKSGGYRTVCQVRYNKSIGGMTAMRGMGYLTVVDAIRLLQARTTCLYSLLLLLRRKALPLEGCLER